MPEQPNIIYILSDEHFGGSMSHMGDPNVRTPYLPIWMAWQRVA